MQLGIRGSEATEATVGRESGPHPAFSIIPSLNLERYHLPPIQGHKYRVARIGESWNTANLRLS